MQSQPGERALKLLADDRTVALIKELAYGPLRPTELERLLPSVGHSPMMERLKRLSGGDLPLCERTRGRGREVRYALNECGRELAEIAKAAARWERETGAFQSLDGDSGDGVLEADGSDTGPQGAPAGANALKLIADEYSRLVGRALVHEPLAQAELERTLQGIAHASLVRRLHHLQLGGVVVPRHVGSRTMYELRPAGRQLALLVLLASRWEHRWGPEEGTAVPTDMRALIHMIAPLGRLLPGLSGLCRLYVEGKTGEPPIDLATGAGRISALPLTSPGPFTATARATAQAWGRALLECDPSHVAIEGDRTLLSAVVVGLGSALRI